jgi:hypothetical protein
MSWNPTEYKGYAYDSEMIIDDDNTKILHYAIKGEHSIWMDWSPYDIPKQSEWETWIDLGLPDRHAAESIGPLRKTDLDILMARRNT